MAQQTYNVQVTFMAGPNAAGARVAIAGIYRFLQSASGATPASTTPGEAIIQVQVQATDSIAAARDGVGLVRAAFDKAGKAPPPLVPVSVKVVSAS